MRHLAYTPVSTNDSIITLYHYAECHVLFVVIVSAIMLMVVILNVIMLIVVILSVAVPVTALFEPTVINRY
jgi:hypothetical protein